MNPSTEEIVAAVAKLAHDDIIILPNNKNIILAARQAAELSPKNIHVIETLYVQQGFSAVLAHSNEASLEKNIQSMSNAALHVHSGEITKAVRDVTIDAVAVREGDYIGLIDGHLCCTGTDVDQVVKNVVSQIDPDDETELFALYYGADVKPVEVESLVADLQAGFPDHTVEFHYGGQPHYYYLISAE